MATQLKLHKFNQLTHNLASFLKHLNTLPLTDTAKRYINGVPVKDIDTTTVLTAHKNTVAKGLPNYDILLAASIDLAKQIPDCQHTKAAVDALVKDIVGFAQYNAEKGLISYDSKAGAFVVNDAGKLALKSAVVTLTADQEQVYNAVQALYNLLAAHNPQLAGKLLNTDVVNSTTKQININTMVSIITTNIDNETK